MNLVAAKNKQNLENELEELQNAVKSSRYNSPLSTLNFGFIRKLFSKNDKKKSNEEKIDRPLIQLYTNIDAQIPDENLSDPSNFAKINNAGLLFIELGETPPIYEFSKTFNQKLSNTESLIDIIISTLNPINVSTSNGFIGILIDSDDLKILLLKCFTEFFKSKPSKESKKYEWKSPLIIKENEGAIAWIKCDLKISIKGKKYGKKKIETELNCSSFYFPTIEDFENVLAGAEKNDNKEGTLL
uniref:Uncharacterized protein n=1 Tax=Panagrolaimus davidi TaxID=227884 RepID=A0A914PSR4_9BILA